MIDRTGVPSGWARAKMEELLVPLRDGRTLHQGWSPQCEDEPAADGEWGVLRTTAIQPGSFVPEYNKRLPPGLEPRPVIEVEPGDILLTCAGPRSRCGVPCLVRASRPKLMLSGKMYRFRVSSGLVDAAFVEAFLLSSDAQAAIDRIKTGGSDSGLNLTHERFRDLHILVAPTAEQRRIVEVIESCFTCLDDAVASLELAQAKLQAYRASVLKAAVEGRLVPTEASLARAENRAFEPAETLLACILKERRHSWEQAELAKLTAAGKTPKDDRWKERYQEPADPDTSELPELPAGWCWASAETLCDGVESGTTPTKDHFAQAGTPFIKVYNLTLDDGRLDFSINPSFVEARYEDERMGRSRTLPGDVLTNIVGPPLGKVSIVPDMFPLWNINQAIARFRPLPGLSGYYLSSFLQSLPSRQWLAGTAKTTTSQVNLSITNCRRLPIPLPPLAEQHRIVDRLEEVLSIARSSVAQVRTSIARANRLRQAVLKWAFEGKLVDQDPTDEPADLLLVRMRAARLTAAPVRKNRGRTAGGEA